MRLTYEVWTKNCFLQFVTILHGQLMFILKIGHESNRTILFENLLKPLDE